MINYIKSEFYRLFHGKDSYIFIAISTILLVSINILLATVKHSDSSFSYASTSFSFNMFSNSFTVIFLLCITVACIVFGNEYTSHTLKNSISYGIPRGSIYLGKLIVEFVYAILSFLVISGFYIGSAYLLLENSGIGYLKILLHTTIAVLPMLFFAITATNCFLFFFNGIGGAITAVISTIVVFPIVCNYLAMRFLFFEVLTKMLPWNLIKQIYFDTTSFQVILPWTGAEGYYRYWIYGLTWMLLFILTGYLLFRKKEIK